MRPKAYFFEQQKTPYPDAGTVRGFFKVLTMLAGAFLAGFLVLSYLNKSNAPTSPELVFPQPESGVYLSVTPENGFCCTVLSETEAENVSAELWIEGGGQSYRSEPVAEKRKLSVCSLTNIELDLSSLRYFPSEAASATSFDAAALVVSLPADASARVVFFANGEPLLTSNAFNPIPFLAGGTYGN